MTWRNPTGRADAEEALDGGKLYAQAAPGRFWLARRNGQTKTWKRDPTRFRIPIKYGLKHCAAIEEYSPWEMLRIADSRDEAEGR